ncbi:MAG: TonB family protein [Alphaproteobacteria bacterium]|nr:TonB family protein [Alphaproteobacteria bacterium]
MVSDKEVLDTPVSKPPPRYPQRMLEQEREGKVSIAITIGPDGIVQDAKVVSSTNSGFDSAALDAVKKWRYRATGRVIKSTVEVTFKLE